MDFAEVSFGMLGDLPPHTCGYSFTYYALEID
jgi:hypothetical protein